MFNIVAQAGNRSVSLLIMQHSNDKGAYSNLPVLRLARGSNASPLRSVVTNARRITHAPGAGATHSLHTHPRRNASADCIRGERGCIGGKAGQSGYRATNSPLQARLSRASRRAVCFKDLFVSLCFFPFLFSSFFFFFLFLFPFVLPPLLFLPPLLRRVLASFLTRVRTFSTWPGGCIEVAATPEHGITLNSTRRFLSIV